MIPKVSTPYEEQETIINISPRQISDCASVYSTLPAMINKLWKLHEKHPDEVKVVHDDKYGIEFSIPRDWIKVSPKRQVSEETKAKLRERLQNLRNNDE